MKNSRSKYFIVVTVILLLLIIILTKSDTIIEDEKLKIINYNNHFSDFFNNNNNQSEKRTYSEFIKDIEIDFNNEIDKNLSDSDNPNSDVAFFIWNFDDEYLVKERTEQIAKFNIEELIENEINKYYETIQNDDLHIYIFPSSDQTMGYTLSDNCIVLYVDCSLNQNEFIDQISWTLAHEYAHAYDYIGYSENTEKKIAHINTLLEDMVFEGKAISFANFMCEKFKMILNSSESEKEWTYYSQIINDENYSTVSTRQSSVGIYLIPRYDIYVYGYLIVQNYIYDNTNLSFKEWIETNSESYLDYILTNEHIVQ